MRPLAHAALSCRRNGGHHSGARAAAPGL